MRHASIALFTAALLGCGGGTADPDAGPRGGREREVLAAIATNVQAPSVHDFAARAETLEAACTAFAADGSDANRDAARAAWIAAMAAWQRLEVMQIGPIGMSGPSGVSGGRSLRDEIYSWPQTSTCRIDQEIVAGDFSDVDAFASELVNVRGLSAIEYLLWAEGDQNSCSAESPINRDGAWAALGADEISSRRRAYARTLAALVRRTALVIDEAWTEGGELDMTAELRSAGESGRLYRSAQRALDENVSALLYLDTLTKDMKVGEPAGILGCPDSSCSNQLESRYSNVSLSNILANLRAARDILIGAEGSLAVDDLLLDIGASAAATELATEIDEAIAAAEAIPTSLAEAIQNQPTLVRALYDALADVARVVKTDVVSVLDIELVGVPTDND